MPTSIVLDLLTDKSYSLKDVRAYCPLAQYVRVIMRHGIGCNIVDMANQLSVDYRGIAPELKVFVLSLTESTRAADFIHTLEEKLEVWYEMMTIPTILNRYPNNFCCPSFFPSSPSRPPLLSQSEVFFCYEA